MRKVKCCLAAVVVLFVIAACNKKNKPPERRTIEVGNKVVIESNNPLSPVDRSPMDMSYYPVDYSTKEMEGMITGAPVARVTYSRPQRNKRTVFADSSITTNVIQHYGQEWRLGANEATEIEFFKDVNIKGKSFAKGRYILYCVPYKDKWTLIFNSNLFTWGLHMDRKKDIAQIDVPITYNNPVMEYFTIVFEKAAYGCNLVMGWGDVKAELPIAFN